MWNTFAFVMFKVILGSFWENVSLVKFHNSSWLQSVNGMSKLPEILVLNFAVLVL